MAGSGPWWGTYDLDSPTSKSGRAWRSSGRTRRVLNLVEQMPNGLWAVCSALLIVFGYSGLKLLFRWIGL